MITSQNTLISFGAAFSVRIVKANPNRTGFVVSTVLGGTKLWTDSANVQNDLGFPVGTIPPYVEITREKHGDLVTLDWFVGASAPAFGQAAVVIETFEYNELEKNHAQRSGKLSSHARVSGDDNSSKKSESQGNYLLAKLRYELFRRLSAKRGSK